MLCASPAFNEQTIRIATMIYDKTEKGQDEIHTRKNHLPSRMRSLLVLVDGKTGDDALLKKVAGLGLTQESIEELLQQGFIAPHPDQTPSEVAVSAPSAEPEAHPDKSAILPEGETQWEALYHFYTTTIKSTAPASTISGRCANPMSTQCSNPRGRKWRAAWGIDWINCCRCRERQSTVCDSKAGGLFIISLRRSREGGNP